MHHQARTSTRDAAVPRPPPANSPGRHAATHRPLPRPPAASPEHHAATYRPLSRPPAASPAHHAAESPLPRPPGHPTPPAVSPVELYDDTERPLPRPPGHPRPRAVSPEELYDDTERPLRRPPGHPRPPAVPPEDHYDDTDRPLRRPPGQYAADHPVPRPPSWPYSDHSGPPRSSALASCLAATAFLLLAVGGAGAALFLLFRPHPPDIAVAAVRLPAFAASNGTVAFTFEQTAVVRNPNRSPLSHFDSFLRVACAGGELGYVYIPAGLIDGGRAKDMSASFDVPAFPAAFPPQTVAAAPPVMEVDSLLVVKGRVTMLRVLTHRVQAAKVCRVGVSPLDGRVLGFRC